MKLTKEELAENKKVLKKAQKLAKNKVLKLGGGGGDLPKMYMQK